MKKLHFWFLHFRFLHFENVKSKARQPLAHYYHNSNFPNFYRWLDTIIHITPPQNDIDTIILLNFSASFLTFLYIPRMSFKMICRRIEKKNISSPISILKVNNIFSPLWTKEISACAFSLLFQFKIVKSKESCSKWNQDLAPVLKYYILCQKLLNWKGFQFFFLKIPNRFLKRVS